MQHAESSPAAFTDPLNSKSISFLSPRMAERKKPVETVGRLDAMLVEIEPREAEE